MNYNNDRYQPRAFSILFVVALLALPMASLYAKTLTYICSDDTTVYKDSPLVINLSKKQAGWGNYINPILYKNQKHVMWGNAFSSGIQSYVFNLQTGVLLQRFLDTNEASNKKLWSRVSKYRCAKSNNA